MKLPRLIKLVLFALLIIAIVLIPIKLINYKEDQQKEANNERGVVEMSGDAYQTAGTIRKFSAEVLSDKVIDRISGLSWKTDAPVKLTDLRYVQVLYWGFDDLEHVGELVVNQAVAEDIIDIFKELYEARFPIERIRLVDDYKADDNLSMEDNNTSAFNFRPVAGTSSLSKHSYGIAIDINPVQNPYITKDSVSPPSGKEYLDREDVRKGMIVQGDVCYNAFVSRGWTWGGSWKSVKDYQHFQKEIIK